MCKCSEMCVNNKECCCKDCEDNLTCIDVCEGEDEQGCEAECENRLSN